MVAGLIDEDLHVLVTVILFLGLEAKGHSQFSTGCFKKSLRCGIGEIVVNGNSMIILRKIFLFKDREPAKSPSKTTSGAETAFA